ncbi:hypothetical protein M406DRAFT_330725 [Cryphonectria parasitica EP155]|uniref:Uncharacterized protein n=1 Tax=Cryphonectria parasitica (strain ATCC 38755 / EP155) TaxID=660469 RepID=A0A9P4Y0Y5_CRYP1|nr:uncharacterized protein M406DRAFT_330725 [Cryphonectria parasitica EP155]KAF3764380.1 hypothetical protein M406DRAFT_330725 [Cryphonectria parasitica EP155]
MLRSFCRPLCARVSLTALIFDYGVQNNTWMVQPDLKDAVLVNITGTCRGCHMAESHGLNLKTFSTTFKSIGNGAWDILINCYKSDCFSGSMTGQNFFSDEGWNVIVRYDDDSCQFIRS